VLAGPLPAYTELTVTDPSVLRILLDQTRQQGYSVTAEERDAGASGISAPVFARETSWSARSGSVARLSDLPRSSRWPGAAGGQGRPAGDQVARGGRAPAADP